MASGGIGGPIWLLGGESVPAPGDTVYDLTGRGIELMAYRMTAMCLTTDAIERTFPLDC